MTDLDFFLAPVPEALAAPAAVLLLRDGFTADFLVRDDLADFLVGLAFVGRFLGLNAVHPVKLGGIDGEMVGKCRICVKLTFSLYAKRSGVVGHSAGITEIGSL